jgi:hypothetical protein
LGRFLPEHAGPAKKPCGIGVQIPGWNPLRCQKIRQRRFNQVDTDAWHGTASALVSNADQVFVCPASPAIPAVDHAAWPSRLAAFAASDAPAEIVAVPDIAGAFVVSRFEYPLDFVE